ncbi:MAG: hypothetical protein JJE51_13580 [Thermoanaerobaculia bacterium]|nr:hypothetical protein [Thermoanaerobaculia bacterium]
MTAAEERRAEVGLPIQWKQNGMLASIVFFGLTCVALGALYGFWHMLDLEAGLFTGIIGLAAAEYLISRHRFFGTGIESALWIGSLFALITALPGEGSEEVILLFAAAALIAGIRLRQAYFGALAVFLVLAYFGTVGDRKALFALAVLATLIALGALTREWQRPSVERFVTLVLITAPIAPAIWSSQYFASGHGVPTEIFVAIYAALTITLIAAGIVMKHHAPFLATIVTATVALIRYQEIKPFALEWQLLALGIVLLAASAIVLRMLRSNTRGFVTTPSGFTMLDEELQIAATLALQPKIAIAEVPETRAQGDGGFGGAGATGDY